MKLICSMLIYCVHNVFINIHFVTSDLQENILTSVLQKPIDMVNSSDINQLRSIVAGGIQRMNHTKRTLEQMNEITAYFHQNETAISLNLDNQDVTVS